MKIEINDDNPLIDGFWWSSSVGHDKWVAIKYERLSDYCYGCGKLGHTSQYCGEEVSMSEVKPRCPRYEPWLSGIKPRINSKWFHVGGDNKSNHVDRDMSRKSWKDIMNESKEFEK